MGGQASRENGKKGGRPKHPGDAGAARGVSHLMVRDRDGTWTEVTDPVIMAKVLNSGERFYRIYARNPDVKRSRTSSIVAFSHFDCHPHARQPG